MAASHTSLLFLLKQSCQFMMQHLTEETVAIQGFFKSLIIRGKRDVSMRDMCVHIVLFKILF